MIPEAAEQQVERLVRDPLVHAFDGAMLLCMMAAGSVLASFLLAAGDR